MSDIIIKFKKYLSINTESFVRNSFGPGYSAYLYLFLDNGENRCMIVHNEESRKYKKEIVDFENIHQDLFKDSFFKGEYYDGVFYITDIVKCDIEEFEESENIKKYIPESCLYFYFFNGKNFLEEYKRKNENNMLKNIIKDYNLFEIYRIKETNEIVRVKTTSDSKILKNMFLNKKENVLKVIFNDRFNKYEISF